MLEGMLGYSDEFGGIETLILSENKEKERVGWVVVFEYQCWGY